MHQHEPATGVHVFPILSPLPPPSIYHPSGSSQCTSPKHLVSCIEHGLAIPFIYDIIHVSMPFYQITPPSPTDSLLFNMLSRLVITLLPRSMLPLISWLQSPSSVIFELRKINSATVSTVSPSTSHGVMGPDAMIFAFWMLSFKPTYSLSSFTFIKRLFSSSSLSAIKVVSSAYLSLLIFLLAIVIPACAFSSPAFLMMHSAYKLHKQSDNIQPWCTLFPTWKQSVVSCPVLTVASWPA